MKYVEYIESSGQQYLDTGLKGGDFDRIELSFSLTAYPGNWGCLFGFQGNYMSGSLSVVATYAGSKKFQCRWGSGSNAVNTPDLELNERHKLSWDSTSKLYVDEILIGEATPGSISDTLNLMLFANNWGAVGQYTSYKLYWCKLYLSNTLVRDFVPIVNDSNAAGLLDNVNDVFYGNSGSSSFTPGPEIEPPPPPTGEFPVTFRQMKVSL